MLFVRDRVVSDRALVQTLALALLFLLGGIGAVAWGIAGQLRASDSRATAEASTADPRPRVGDVLAEAVAARSRGELLAALSLVDRALAVEPGSAVVWLERARCQRRLGRATRALADVREAGRLRPDWAEPWAERALVHLRRGERVEAARATRQARVLDAGGYAARLAQACLLQGEGRLAASLELLDALLGEAEQVDVLLARGRVRGELRDDEGAVADLSRALELAPGDARVWLTRAQLRRRLDPVGALADLEEALSREPRLGEALFLRAALRARREELPAALRDAQRAAELLPDAFAPQLQLARLRQQADQEDAARRAYDRALTLRPDDGEALAERGTLHLRARRLEAAIADLSRASALLPQSARVWFRLGRARLLRAKRAGLPPEVQALGDLDRAVEIDPLLSKAYLDRGLARAEIGNRRGARRDLKRFLRLAPGDPQARVAIRTLERLLD